MLFAFFTLLTFSLMEQKEMMGKTAGSLAQMKAVTTNCTGSHCIIQHSLFLK